MLCSASRALLLRISWGMCPSPSAALHKPPSQSRRVRLARTVRKQPLDTVQDATYPTDLSRKRDTEQQDLLVLIRDLAVGCARQIEGLAFQRPATLCHRDPIWPSPRPTLQPSLVFLKRRLGHKGSATGCPWIEDPSLPWHYS